eukprot:g953.t1
MYRSLKSVNRYVTEREQSRRMKIHRDRLKNIKPSIDTRPPKNFRDKRRRNRKKEQQMEGRASAKSLNHGYRRDRLKKITDENQAILKRIQSCAPTYNHSKWEQDYERNQQYLYNMCEYKPKMKSRRQRRPRTSLGFYSTGERQGMGLGLTSSQKSLPPLRPSTSAGVITMSPSNSSIRPGSRLSSRMRG